LKVNIGKYPKKFTTERKISVQIDDFDTWSLDHTLALIIHPALLKFKEDSLNTGHPCLCDDPSVCTIEGNVCTCSDQWQMILDKMIWSFEQIITDDINSYRLDQYKQYETRMQEGLELFGKYFRSLWT
jgi:hypothetical protein